MADEHDRGPVLLEAVEHAGELLDLLRRQDRGRLVEHEDPRVAIERLEDLDPLLGADRDVLDLGVGIDRQAVAIGELADPARAAFRSSRPPLLLGSWPSTMFSATVITGTSMKCWWTMPIPSLIAADGEAISTGLPSTRISPASGLYRPYRTDISVDLPAPFSPSSA